MGLFGKSFDEKVTYPLYPPLQRKPTALLAVHWKRQHCLPVADGAATVEEEKTP